MDKYLKPARFDCDPNAAGADKQFKHWLATLKNFISNITIPSTTTQTDGDGNTTTVTTAASPASDKKLEVLMNYVAANVFEYIHDCDTYDQAIETLKNIYVKPVNEIYARYKLATRKQTESESLDAFIQDLHRLSKDCTFQAVTAEEHRQGYVRDAFISGIRSKEIRQKLLENASLPMDEIFKQARTLQTAHKNAESYATTSLAVCSPMPFQQSMPEELFSDHQQRQQHQQQQLMPLQQPPPPDNTVAAAYPQFNIPLNGCWNCGHPRHQSRNHCPARKHKCKLCGILGHWERVCQKSKKRQQQQQPPLQQQPAPVQSAAIWPFLAAVPSGNKKTAFCDIKIKNTKLQALADTGSLSLSFINKLLATRLNLTIIPAVDVPGVAMADSSVTAKIEGQVFVDIMLQNRKYENVKLYVLDNLCADVILGQDFMKQHNSVVFNFGGNKPALIVSCVGHVNALTAMEIPPPKLFEHLTPDCRPVAVRSRKQTPSNRKFIKETVKKLFEDGIIRRSTSTWRAQVLVTKEDETHKKRMVVDYKQTINRFTELDAYPLPDAEEMVRDISQYSWFSTFDLKSAYHQVPIREDERKYTAFEADGGLWEFNRMPFGVTNGVSKFQRVIDTLVEKEGLTQTFPFLDNVTVAAHSAEELREKEAEFRAVAKKYNLTLNESKTVSCVQSLPIIGYLVSHGEIKPDPERLLPLHNMLAPCDLDSQRRIIGMFAYYSRWIPKYSEKIRPLNNNRTFPLPPEALKVFQSLKDEIAAATLMTPLEDVQFEVETDASDYAIAATLNQAGRPVAFFSRTLNKSEHHHPPVEKEACAIVEAVGKWRHFLQGRHFKLITDQRSVAFMYDRKRPNSKVKNDKIMRWCTDLSPYSYDIVYRPGPENKGADTLSRHVCSAILASTNNLKLLHDSLCHPGITRFNHYTRTKNIPCSIEDIRKLTASCPTCLKLKPQYHKSDGTLIKATQPFERINIDFKGPLPSTTGNRYILTIVDEFSRYPFAFPVRDMVTPTVIKCLVQLFSLFGMPGYVHSDRGPSLISEELKSFLHSRGIATSRTSSYNPQGNGQVERYNGIIWKTVSLALESRGLPQSNWELLLPDALHSIRSLLCTATNCTPHERLFSYQRRSASGHSVPSWLSSGERAYLRNRVRQSKFDPLVEEVEVLDVNPQYAHVKLPSGCESTVSIRDLAPCDNAGCAEERETTEPNPSGVPTSQATPVPPTSQATPIPLEAQTSTETAHPETLENTTPPATPGLRRSTRVSKPPARLITEV